MLKPIMVENILDKNNNPYPIGRNISIVFGQHPVVISTDGYYEYTSNSAAGYAGMVSTLPLDQSSTNQPINFFFYFSKFNAISN